MYVTKYVRLRLVQTLCEVNSWLLLMFIYEQMISNEHFLNNNQVGFHEDKYVTNQRQASEEMHFCK